MPHCSKCGSEVDEKMVFCPKCGASLKMERSPDWREEWRARRRDWREQRRELRRQRRQAAKGEKEEEWERTEKHEYMFIGPLIGGLVLLALGALLYLVVGGLGAQMLSALFFVFVGVIIIAAAVYFIVVTGRRHPKP